MVANPRNWEQLTGPARHDRTPARWCIKQREDMAKLDATLEAQLKEED